MRNDTPQMSFFMQSAGGRVEFDYYSFVDFFLNQNRYVSLSLERYFHYLPEKGIWMEEEIEEIICDMGKFLNQYSPRTYRAKHDKDLKAVFNNMVERVENMNPNSDLLCLSNGVVSLKEGGLRNFSADYYLTTRLEHEYDMQATCPKFQKFLQQICCKNASRVQTIEEIMGYCLTRDISAQVLFYFYGNGRNGKSCLMNVIQAMMGETNYVITTPAELQEGFGRGMLRDKRIIFISDLNPKERARLLSAEVKKIVGGDTLSGDSKYKQRFQFKPCGKIIVSSNFEMSFSEDRTNGGVRRFHIIPFEYTVSKDKVNVNLEKELTAEMSGILNLALKGYRRLVRNNYKFSNQLESETLKRKLLKEDVSFERFTEERMIYAEYSFVSYQVIKESYHVWCKKNGVDEVSIPDSKEIGRIIKRRYGAIASKRNSLRGLKGIRIK